MTPTERVAVVLYGLYGPMNCSWLGESPAGRRPYLTAAEAVLEGLDLGIPCANTGCRMRQIARSHAGASNVLSVADDTTQNVNDD